MKRGEIWLVAGGVYASKPRPAVVPQDDRFGATDAVTMCPLTTTDVSAPLLRMLVAADPISFLDKASHAMVDKLTTARRSNVVRLTGSHSQAQVVDRERLVTAFLGLAD